MRRIGHGWFGRPRNSSVSVAFLADDVSRIKRLVLATATVALAAVGLGACSPDGPITDVPGHSGMHYQTVRAGSSTFTVYWRDAGSPRGGLMLVHGGGWVSGQRARFTQEAMQLADRGYVAATVDYRLASGSPSDAWPAQEQDTLAAWRALRSRAATYRLRTSSLAIAGESAGGHIVLASVEAMLPGERPAAVVSWSGPTDLVAWMTNPQPTCSGKECVYYTPLAGNISTKLLRCRYSACPSRYVAASPDRNVSSRMPPTLQTFFVRDVVPDSQGRRMNDALLNKGGISVLKMYPGFGHGGTWTPQVWNDSIAFLQQYMGLVPSRSGQPSVRQQPVQRVPLTELTR
jgi:acetyl esterase/lipase